MEQKATSFVKCHGFFLVFVFLMCGTIIWYSPVVKASLAEEKVLCTLRHYNGCKLSQFVERLLPIFWSVQGLVLFVGLIKENPRCLKLIRWTCVGTIGMEVLLLMVEFTKLRLWFLSFWIITIAFSALYSFYILLTLEQIFTDLKLKRQEAVLITATVCEVEEGEQ